jgi:hypothetical protein
MAAGMLTKQAVFLPAKLNQVNDAVAGGGVVALPAGLTGPSVSQTVPGDKIVLDDISALALSLTTTGTLYGGVYMYVLTLSSSTAAPARGTAAFWRAADIPSATSNLYQVSADAQPSTTLPSFHAGTFINAITKGNYGWIQVAGIASCLFDSTILATAVGGLVAPRGANGTAATVASTYDCGVAVATPGSAIIANSQISCAYGVAIVLPVVSTITTVMITRSPFPRI